MTTELSVDVVRGRLAWLGENARLETAAEAARRLAVERPTEPFAVAVRRRLADLRALSALSTHLHRRR